MSKVVSRSSLLLLLMLLTISGSSYGFAQVAESCPSAPNVYANEGYTVKAIKIHTARDPFGSIDKKVAAILKDAKFKLKENQKFDSNAYVESLQFLKSNFLPAENSPQRIRLYVTSSRLKACDEQAKTLEAHYYAYSTDYVQYLSSIFEGAHNELARAVVGTPFTRFLAGTSPQPYVSFDRARGVYGGSRLKIELQNPVLNALRVNASGSSSSAVVGTGFQGSRDLTTKALDHMEWLAGYRYANIPSVATNLKEGKGYAQWIGATAPLGKLGLVLRYGAAIEGGNRQSQLVPGAASPAIVPSESYGALKVFGGGTFRTENQEFTASYGLELGKTGAGVHLDYTKNLFDVGHSIRLLPWDHRPITIDSRFTAGSLNQRGNVPVATRFFGGNSENNFINSDDWIIQSTPLIRSFSQNRFVPEGQAVAIGGDKFVSFNLTVAPTVWGQPLVPPEVSENPDFRHGACIELDSAEFGLFYKNVAGSKPVKDLVDEFVKTNDPAGALDQLDGAFKSLETKFAEKPDALKKVRAAGRPLSENRKALRQYSSGDLDATDLLDALLGIDQPGLLNQLDDRLHELTVIPEAGQPEYTAEFRVIGVQTQRIDALNREKPCLYTCMLHDPDPYVCIDNVSAPCDPACLAALDETTKQTILNLGPKARLEAKATLVPARAAFERLTRELNLIAISPVFMFDAAKVTAKASPGVNRTRYGVGTGVQVSIVSLDVRLGYSFNVHRRTSDPRGAFVFSLSVSDLLR